MRAASLALLVLSLLVAGGAMTSRDRTTYLIGLLLAAALSVVAAWLAVEWALQHDSGGTP